MIRIPARGESMGSLFVNPGGPGASAVEYASVAEFVLGEAVLDSFDIIGVDPRGVGYSSPIECFTDEKRDQLIATSFSVGETVDLDELTRLYAEPGVLCREKGGQLLDHVSTVDAARDLDIARAAVGDSTLNFLGKSYGSALGGMYLRLFPMNLGRVVLDGVLPVDVDKVEITRRQAEGFEAATADFIRDCLTYADCPFGDSPVNALSQLRGFLAGLDENPLPTQDAGRPLNSSLAASAMLLYLYAPETDYPRLRKGLAAAINDNDGSDLLTMLDERVKRSPDGEYLDSSRDANLAVNCIDVPFDGTVREAIALSEELAISSPTFGEGVGRGILVCRDWPATGPAIPPLPSMTNAPVLVVNPKNDPATPFVWAQRVHEQLPNSRLVSWDAHNHTAYFAGSRCVDEAVETFLLTGEAPELTECAS
jgi:pimeloyl-ACP methyl ester carboxylesterase